MQLQSGIIEVHNIKIADFYPNRGLGFERIMDRIAIEGDNPNKINENNL